MFAVTLPKDKPTLEVVWTVTSHGHTFSIPANLDPLYIVEALGTMYTKNEPPKLRLVAEGSPVVGPGGPTTSLATTTSKPLTIDVWVSDDTIPPRRRAAPTPRPQPAPPEGLNVAWSKFRGAGKVNFSNAAPPIENGKATTNVTFEEPGDYALRVLASDGSSLSGQCCWTNGYVRVRVEADK